MSGQLHAPPLTMVDVEIDGEKLSAFRRRCYRAASSPSKVLDHLINAWLDEKERKR